MEHHTKRWGSLATSLEAIYYSDKSVNSMQFFLVYKKNK